MTIVRDRPPFVYTMLISVVCAMIAIGCAVASIREWNEFALWLLVGSLLMLFASLGQRYIYRVTQIQEQDVLQERRIFGSFSRQKVNRVDLASVSVEPRKVQNDDETPHVEFDIFLLSTGSKETRMHLACIRTRLVAKAFAKAIANELNLPVIYQVSDRSYSTPDAT